jgi:hypothetical protein
MICYQNDQNSEDAVLYQVGDDGIIAYHGPYHDHRPPSSLLLVFQRIHNEAREQFVSTTTFEVHPLTPHALSWHPKFLLQANMRLHSVYLAIAESVYTPLIRKLRVRVEITTFKQSREILRPGWVGPHMVTACEFNKTDMEESIREVAASARKLCEVLKTCATDLSVMEIDWINDYPNALRESELLMRAVVLLPFTKLIRVQVQVRKLVMSGSGKAEVMEIINRV